MAYAAVASLLQTIHILLNHHQRSISPQFKTQIISIHENTSSLQSFIEGFSDRVNNWEETIRQVTSKAEDIIELLLSDSLLESTDGSSRSEVEKGKYEVRYNFDELEKVAEEIESIAIRVKGRRRIETADGSDEEVMKIISRLRGGSAALEIIAISGIGGMGKTALAGDAYNHPLIVEHFDVRVGSIVSREYTLVRVIGDFLRCMKAEFSISNSEDELIERFLQILGHRKFLIVLFDVWTLEVLERLNVMLRDHGNGSRILLTTSSSDLAKSAHHIHEMHLMDEDKTWNLLREKIFKGDPCPFQLESMGKTIARSCGGHPLSIEVVSGILACDLTEAAWEGVSDDIEIASQDGNKLYEILYLSYIYLPHYLRPCFLFLGIYPQGRAIYVSRLVKLWVAEGFVNENGSKNLEETGQEYVEDLLRRSLVSVHRRKSNGRIKSIIVHDLIRNMCLEQAHLDNFNLDFDRVCCSRPRWEVEGIIKSCRRVNNLVFCDDFLSGVYGSTIRTLLLNLEHGELDLRCWMENVRLLRILSLSNVYKYHLSSEVFELFHLRYLALYWEFNIPEAISNLQNLQTLIISHEKIGGVFDELPEGIWKMPQLRHLFIFCFKFPNEKGAISALETLQTLSRIVDFVCSRENLKMIPNLKNLALLYTCNLRNVVEDYELCNLIYLQKLEVLKIKTNLPIAKEHQTSCATFPPTLKKLSLRGVQLSWEDMKTVASLPNLEVLKLRNYACAGETWETSEGGFSKLLFLLIEESNLENWITKSSPFPRLWRLVLVRCQSLLEVPYEMAEIPTLQLIHLDDTNRSLWRSAEQIRQDRHRLGYDPLVVYVD